MDDKTLARFPASRGAHATMDFDIVLVHLADTPHFKQGTPFVVWAELTGSKAHTGGEYSKSLEEARYKFLARCDRYKGAGNLANEHLAHPLKLPA